MKRFIWIAIGGMVLLLFVGNALAASGFTVNWWTVDGGGGASSGGAGSGVGFALNGAIGQADAGVSMSGEGYQLTGGFWSAAGQAAQQTQKIYLPLVTR